MPKPTHFFRQACVSTLILFMIFSGSALAADRLTGEYAPNRILVKFKEVPNKAAVKNFASNHNLRLRRVIPSIIVHGFKIDGGRSVGEVVARLSADPRVAFAEPDYIRYSTYIPNDPFFGSQWDMTHIGMPAYWDFFAGLPVVVTAVIDTGIALTHPDFADQLWVNVGEVFANGIDDDGNGYVDDIWGYDFAGDGAFPAPGAKDWLPNDDLSGHGTHVSGTIAAQQDNSIGITGVAPGTKLMAVRVLGGALGIGFSSDIAEGVTYATDNGAHVINMSLGGTAASLTEYLALKHAWDNNVFIAAASGNDGDSGNPVSYPNGFAFTTSVGATDNLDAIASFSSHNIFVEVSAPGVNIFSTVPISMGSYQGGWNGTSMATPHVAGLAALLYSTDPANMKNWQVRSMLQRATVDVGAAGWDQFFGHGRVSATELIVVSRPTGDNLEILTPPDGGVFPPGSLMALLWNPVNGAVNYRITANLPTGGTATINTTDPYYTHPPSSPAPPGTYTVTVDALDGGGSTISSDTVTFVR